MEKLINFWKEINTNQKPFIHPKDYGNINKEQCHSFIGIENYYSETYWEDKGLFHTDLLPVPYSGNLKNAKIFILLLNPGFNFIDYHAENNSTDFKQDLTNNLFQSNLNNTEFPFFYLNPKYFWHSGGQYWLNHFKDYIKSFIEEKGMSTYDATKTISQKVAILELLPYHSNHFTQNKLLNRLESVKIMKEYVKQHLIPKAIKDEVCIICTRKTREWNLPEHKNIVIYKGHECRSAHISNKTRAYPVIKRFLNK